MGLGLMRVAAARGGSLLFDQYVSFDILKPKNRKSGLGRASGVYGADGRSYDSPSANGNSIRFFGFSV
jgi:hypothetical protein